ncbi:MAG: hypothetical protein ACRCX2_36195 [Paraclostridium sp.]
MYRYKINMKNGDRFIVKHTEKDFVKFIELILGANPQTRVVSIVDLATEYNYKYGNEFEYNFKSDGVAIISHDVSSIEFLGAK